MIKEGAGFGGSEAFAGVGRANNNSNVGNANNVNGVAGANTLFILSDLATFADNRTQNGKTCTTESL